jgi:hypothetical protein
MKPETGDRKPETEAIAFSDFYRLAAMQANVQTNFYGSFPSKERKMINVTPVKSDPLQLEP